MRRFISIFDTSSISGNESIMTAQAYTEMSMPTVASVRWKSFFMSVSKPMGTNSEVLKIKVAKVRPSSESQLASDILSCI